MEKYVKIVIGDKVFFVPDTHSLAFMPNPSTTALLDAADLAVTGYTVVKNRNGVSGVRN